MEVERSRHRLRAKRERFLRLDATDSPPSYRRCRQELVTMIENFPSLVGRSHQISLAQKTAVLTHQKEFKIIRKNVWQKNNKERRKQGIHQNFCAFKTNLYL